MTITMNLDVARNVSDLIAKIVKRFQEMSVGDGGKK